ncbi:protein 60A-like [Condylostylus longicornis]|uniref:protein 60A-like n=1 Tax=Condylostylus longicornis TaxID=2530218 RepID=UPI00244DE262|nr:protein 60A-like [Condylostylus longicornis]
MKIFKNLLKYLIFITICIINNCCYFVKCHHSSSGIYYDNGIDRTILHRYLDKYEMNRVENDIMNLIGLPSKRNPGHLMSLRNSAPQFLLNVYDKLMNKENSVYFRRSKREVFPDNTNLITDIDEKAFRKSDIIMAFLHKDHHIAEVRHEHGRKLWFDVSEVSRDAILMMAELRIFQNSKLGNLNGLKKHIIITVYSIVKADGQKELEIVSSVNTTTEYHGWLEMNVTDVLDKWLKNPKENNGLYISAHEDGRPRHEIKLSDIGYVNVHGDEEYQTFLVGYFKGPEINKIPRSLHRIKRDSFSYKPKNPFSNIGRQQDLHTERECKLHFLHVSFDELPSADNIIAPEGYEAYYCKGECVFPLNAHMNATSHAIVQALVHLMVGGVPKPLCAPLKLGAIQILYFVDDSNVVLKKVNNMVVKRCGCQ